MRATTGSPVAPRIQGASMHARNAQPHQPDPLPTGQPPVGSPKEAAADTLDASGFLNRREAESAAVVDGIPAVLNAALAGRFAIERELGRGGMATVYLASDLRLPRKVAVKVLHPALAESLAQDRFVQETRIIARLAHPNILALHEAGSAGSLLYYIMPYIEGKSLRDLLAEKGRLTLAQARQ